MPRMKQEEIKTPEIKVTRAHQFDDGNISFDMEVNGVSIYGCMFIKRKKDGAYFVSFPSKKDKEGKYWNHAFVSLSDADIENIDKQLDEIL